MIYEFWQIFTLPLVVIIGCLLNISIGRKLELTTGRIILIYIWHTIFALIYFFYVFSYGGDANGYFLDAKEKNFETSIGNLGIIFLTLFFHEYLGFDFLEISLIFGSIGSIGLLLFDSSLQAATANKEKWLRYLTTVIIFLPSISFWSSGLGKDPLSFLSTCLSLWAALKFKKRFPYMVASIIIMFTVRPHIAGIMAISLVPALIFARKIAIPKKILLVITSISAIFILLPFALNYSGLGTNLDIESILSYIHQRQSYNMEGGGAIDISKMNLFQQLFAYMFRPFIFDINNIFTAAAAFDNFILIIIFTLGVWSIIKGSRSELGENRVFLWSYSLTAWIILATTNANMGIALRQKWMFAPILIFLLITLLGQRRKIN